MTFHRKLILIIAGIVVFVITPFALWHEEMDAYFASEEYREGLAAIRPFAWLIGIGLLAADLVLPIPSSQVISTMGVLYGTWLGGLVSTVGLMLAGYIAYGAARLLGERGSRWLASEEELERFRAFFDTWGVAGIIGSRALPVVPEVLALLAGLARMHLGRFSAALAVGSLPIGLLMAWAGAAVGHSAALLLVLTLLPAGLWCVYLVALAALAGHARRPRPGVPGGAIDRGTAPAVHTDAGEEPRADPSPSSG